MKPDHITYWKWKGIDYRFDIYFADDFSHLKKVNQVYSFVLNKKRNKVIIVYNNKVYWILPGGTVEEGEDLRDTLVREVKEETNRDVDINTATPFFYQEVFLKDEEGLWKRQCCQVRYLVVVSNDNKFVSDPDEGDIIKVKWIPVEDVGRYLNWGKTSKMIDENIQKFIDKMK